MQRKSTDCGVVKKSCTIKKCNETQRTDFSLLFVCANLSWQGREMHHREPVILHRIEREIYGIITKSAIHDLGFFTPAVNMHLQ